MTSLPNREGTNQHPDANTAANKTKDPHSPLVEVSNKLDTGMSDVVARHNPSHTYSNINGKEYTFAPEPHRLIDT